MLNNFNLPLNIRIKQKSTQIIRVQLNEFRMTIPCKCHPDSEMQH